MSSSKKNATSRDFHNVVYVYDPVECFMVIVLGKTQGIRSLTLWRLTFVKIICKNCISGRLVNNTTSWYEECIFNSISNDMFRPNHGHHQV